MKQCDFLSRETGYELEQGTKFILDIIRICLASGVMLGHGFYAYDLTFLRDDTYFPAIQSLSVVGFFWLSGFLMSYSVMARRENYNCWKFLAHKAKRIIPEYWTCILVVYIIDRVHIYLAPDKYAFYEAFNIKTCAYNMFMLQGMPIETVGVFADIFGSARPLWTISVQWWFWILVAVVFMFMFNSNINIMEMVVACIVFIFGMAITNNFLILFFLGMLSFFLYKKLSKRVAMVSGCIFATLFIIYGHFIRQAYSASTFVLISLLLTCVLSAVKDMHIRTHRRLRIISEMTFEVYCIHYSVNLLLMDCFTWGEKAKFGIGILMSCIISTMVYFGLRFAKICAVRMKGQKMA